MRDSGEGKGWQRKLGLPFPKITTLFLNVIFKHLTETGISQSKCKSLEKIRTPHKLIFLCLITAKYIATQPVTEKNGLLLRSVYTEDGIWTYFYFMCMSAWMHACMDMCYMHAWCSRRPEERPGSPWTGLTESCEWQCRFWVFTKAISALNYWATSPTTLSFLFALFFIFFPIHPQAAGPYLNLPNTQLWCEM